MGMYQDKLNEIKELFGSFVAEAERGKEGHGSKAAALRSRKLVSQLSSAMKEFRKISIENDKLK